MSRLSRNMARTGPEQDRDLPLASIANTLRITVVVCGIGLSLWLLSSFALILFIAVLFALLLRGLSDMLTRWTRVPGGVSLAVVVLVIAALSALAIYEEGPRFVNQTQLLWQTLVPELESLRQRYGSTPWGHAIENAMPATSSGHLSLPAVSMVDTTFSGITTAVVVVIAAIYLAAAPDLYVSGTAALFSHGLRPRVRQVMHDCGRILQWWMLGQGINMLAVGALSTTGLWLLHVPLPIALGVMAGLLTFIPYFGAWIGFIPAVLLALTESVPTALWTTVVFLVCHLVEGYLLSPLVQRRIVHLPPALTLLSMSLLGEFYGPFGLALAAPITAVALVAVQEGYVAAVLGDGLGKNKCQGPTS